MKEKIIISKDEFDKYFEAAYTEGYEACKEKREAEKEQIIKALEEEKEACKRIEKESSTYQYEHTKARSYRLGLDFAIEIVRGGEK